MTFGTKWYTYTIEPQVVSYNNMTTFTLILQKCPNLSKTGTSPWWDRFTQVQVDNAITFWHPLIGSYNSLTHSYNNLTHSHNNLTHSHNSLTHSYNSLTLLL